MNYNFQIVPLHPTNNESALTCGYCSTPFCVIPEGMFFVSEEQSCIRWGRLT